MALNNKDDSGNTVHIRITVPDISFQTLMVFHLTDTVWSVKQKLLSTVALKDLQDGLNYGLYCLPVNGKAGKFLDEERLLKEYPFSSPIGTLEFKYKKRVYKTTPPDAVRMKKLHSQSNLRALMEFVQKGDTDKISALTNRGLDPNFIDRASGETPLTLSATLPRSRTVMLVLVGGGALLDYRNSNSLTPVHVAVRSGNRDALMADIRRPSVLKKSAPSELMGPNVSKAIGIKLWTLLDLGASPNYKDRRGLTPLYHTVTRESRAGPQCVQMLLHDRAEIGSYDEDGNTELHQGCLNGRVQHIEHLVFYGADLNAQNSRGDTPLHICARYNQEECARVLLFRGADKTIENNFHEDAFLVANTSEHSNLAEIIRCFRRDDIVLFQELPTYNEKRRGTISAATLRNLQRSRSNPQLNLLFDSHMSANGSASLSSAYQYSSNGFLAKTSRADAVRPALYSDVTEQYPLHRPVTNHSSHSSHSSHSRECNPRNIVLLKDRNGFGFILRGAKSRPGFPSLLDFSPSSEFPSLQYFDFIEENSVAANAGLRCGDFLLEINGVNVVNATHEHAVNLIRTAGDTLTMVVVEGRPSHQSTTVNHHAEQINIENAQSVRPMITGSSSFKPVPVAINSNTWSHTSVEGLEELERLDATLDNYEQDFVRRQPMTPYNGIDFVPSVTKAEMHKPPSIQPQVTIHMSALPPEDYLLEPEPDPDYDVDDLPPPPDLQQSNHIDGSVNVPVPPPLPVSIGIPYQYSSSLSKADGNQLKQSGTVRQPEVSNGVVKQRDEAHAALLAAVQRRRNLLESVEGNQIAEVIENRVQRSKKMQQTIYRADSGTAEVRHSPGVDDDFNPVVLPVGLQSASLSSSAGSSTSRVVDFSAEAEKARLDFLKKSASGISANSVPSPIGPPPKPPRPLPDGASVRHESNGRRQPVANGTTPHFMSTYSPVLNSATTGLKVETYDELSLVSSVSTASTASSMEHEGSPSHSSTGDSGYGKSTSTSPHGGDSEQLIIAPPAEFAAMTSSDAVNIPTGGLRSVAKQQSNSMVFLARARIE